MRAGRGGEQAVEFVEGDLDRLVREGGADQDATAVVVAPADRGDRALRMANGRTNPSL